MIDTSKIIHAPVGGGRCTTTAPIMKEHYGIYLKIEGAELPETYEVDFSNDEFNGSAVTMIGNADGVLIPHQFIDTGRDVFAFLYWVGEDYGKTVYKFKIPNRFRPDRTNEEPTPEEQSTIDQAISALNTAVAQTAQDVIDADASAQSAQGYAESAEGYAESASTSASNALASETNAERYADRAETAESHAQDYASQASGSALSADDSAETAEAYATGKRDGVDVGSSDPTYHNNSKYYSEQASASATTASTKAGEASESASTASSKATEASGYASTASTKAGEASTSAQTASDKATEASQSATTASNKASEASGYATSASQAKTDAESARDSAITAQGLAEDARDDAIQAKEDAESAAASISGALNDKADIITDTASGAIASFSDGADDLPLKSLVVNIDPVQDLHGQANPYPAGGGKNKFDSSVYSAYLQSDGKYRANALQIDSIQIPIPSTLLNTACTFSFYANMTNSGTLTAVYAQAVVGGTNKNGTVVQNGSIGRSIVTFTPTSESDYIHITYGTNANSFTFYNIQLEANSAATDYAPYSNICPITGWTEIGVNQFAVNVWDEEWELGGLNNATGYPDSGTDRIRSANYIPILPNTTYYASIPSGAFFVYFYDKEKNYVTPRQQVAGKAFTTPSNAYYMRWHTYDGSGASSQYGTTYNHDISINYPSTDHDYHPYSGRSITINLGQTVYGGHLDVVSGVMTVDRAMVALKDLPTNRWNKLASGTGAVYMARANAFPDGIEYPLAVDRYPISDTYTYQVSGTMENGSMRVSDALYIVDDRFSTLPDWINYVITCGTKVVYPLATPITYQLTPTEVKSLLGQNHVWADTGDSTVEYCADTKLYIQRLTEPDADMIADSNIVSGQYFMVGNNLYKATANIASGSAIVVGTNCIRKSLSEALNEINA